MLRTLLSLSLTLVLTHSYSQSIEIDGTDLPSPGVSVLVSEASDSALNLEDFILPGIDEEWEFNELVAVSQSTDTFISVSSLNLGYQFTFGDASFVQLLPEADSVFDLSFQDIELSNALQFFRVDSLGYFDLGIGFELNIFGALQGRRDPDQLLFRLPMRFGDTATTSSQLTFEFTLIEFFYTQKQTLTYEVDAEGMLTTPLGSFETLRVKSTTMLEDSLSFSDTTTTFQFPERTLYSWWGKGANVPLLEINTFEREGGTDITRISYQDSIRDLTTSIKVLPQANLNVYPNPATNETHIKLDNDRWPKGTLEIINLEGKKLLLLPLSGISSVVPLHNLPAGVYTVRIITEQAIHTGRLMIKRD